MSDFSFEGAFASGLFADYFLWIKKKTEKNKILKISKISKIKNPKQNGKTWLEQWKKMARAKLNALKEQCLSVNLVWTSMELFEA